MLAFVSIFLLSLAVSVIAVWMYRLLVNWRRYVQSQVDNSGSASWRKLATQQGFLTFLSAPKEQVRATRLSRSKGGIKAPWGW